MKKYNEEYISSYSEQDICDSTHNSLNDLFENFKKRYSTREKVNGNDLTKLESIDHYVTANFLNTYDFISSITFKSYINFLKKIEFEKSSYVFQNNFINNIGDKTLSSLLGKDKFNEINMIRKSGNKLITSIINKMNKREEISQQELDIACDYFAFNRDVNNRQHSDLIRYIFNELTKPNTKLSCSCFVLDAITSYLPKFFKYNKDFDAQNVRV